MTFNINALMFLTAHEYIIVNDLFLIKYRIVISLPIRTWCCITARTESFLVPFMWTLQTCGQCHTYTYVFINPIWLWLPSETPSLLSRCTILILEIGQPTNAMMATRLRFHYINDAQTSVNSLMLFYIRHKHSS